jgi:hypothetical protein
MIRNVQAFGEIVPIVDTTYLHLWIGANAEARGGPQDEAALRKSLQPERLGLLLAEKDQAQRYQLLARDVWAAVDADPAMAVTRRMQSALCFVFGAAWFERMALVREIARPDLPQWIVDGLPSAFPVLLGGELFLGLVGWRWSYGWRREANLASLALVWIPLPYILGHAENFSGPRLPLDGVLCCFAAFALAWMLPPVARVVFAPPEAP